jgi:hypothetical protein
MSLKRQDSGFGIQEVKEQEAGFRIQESGVRSQNAGHLLSASCLLHLGSA